ncbi:hypothetical protein JJJ17_09700 [Paracoccus caeni]|uniref:Uncharacterized protein n=1 Tax=Paracoccus caeni TaxID=657651 RepID=A0A934VYN8_9RHOB|nr:hypothetical protein [Paracoccus caeni]MBK4216197.1 hypothetical protein [Paracoccus caeni]
MSDGPNAADWAIALEPGERILWMGQPVGPAKADRATSFFRLFGAIFALGGLPFLGIGLLVDAGDPMFNLIFAGLGASALVIGLSVLILPARFTKARLAKTRYALTDRHALVYEGQAIKSWNITPTMQVEVHPGTPGSLIFGQEELAIEINGAPAYRDIGFIMIPDVIEVGKMIRDIQSRQLSNTEAAG